MIMTSKQLLNALIESSSLRIDLLQHISEIIIDLLENIDLSDELLARVNDNTYNFIKEYKYGKESNK